MKTATVEIVFINDYITYEGDDNYTIHGDGCHVHLWMDRCYVHNGLVQASWDIDDDEYGLVTDAALAAIRAHMASCAA